MPRRHREEGPSLESDSFLDVVANIVGILIILIVVVGVRVGQSAAEADAPDVDRPAAPVIAPVVAPRPYIVQSPTPASPPAPVESPELLASIDATRRETDALRIERLALAKTADQLANAGTTLAAHAEEAVVEKATLANALENSEAQVARLDAEVEDLRSQLAGLGRQISDVPAPNVTVLRHKLNPIGREVQGNELHFRVAEGRVARVPIKELIEQLKPEIERRKDWVARYRRHRGTIGPIDGFSMEYIVERQRLSVVEELQQNAQLMRIVVSGWKVVPEAGLVAEPVETALRGDSQFLTTLRLADAETTLTFWVYPDSFEAYRRLQAAAHAAGLDVAARPLPAGVPIAGSPNGSRSSSQ